MFFSLTVTADRYRSSSKNVIIPYTVRCVRHSEDYSNEADAFTIRVKYSFLGKQSFNSFNLFVCVCFKTIGLKQATRLLRKLSRRGLLIRAVNIKKKKKKANGHFQSVINDNQSNMLIILNNDSDSCYIVFVEVQFVVQIVQ